jgi:hypothetical protein
VHNGQVLRSKERQIAFNISNYNKSNNPERNVSWAMSVTAESTGISRVSVSIEGIMAL